MLKTLFTAALKNLFSAETNPDPFRPAGEENKTLTTSSDTFEYKSQSQSEDFNDDWSELRSAEQMGAANGNRRIRPSPADHRRIRMKPADDLKPADSPQDDVSIKFTKKQSKTNRNSAMRIILKRNLGVDSIK